ncbi:hypothetical protein GCM10022197_11660 [Microlunatus spumicola]|uniref:Lipoprotein n=1 Tax=Microlunatus spumicola TaxID=81499 RepID=A0ABP6WXL8_9ACTN
MTLHARLFAPALAAAACAVLLLSGCSSPQTLSQNTGEGEQKSDNSTPGAAETPATEGKATLVKTGFGKDGDYGWASAIVTNSSADNVGMFVTVQFNLLDSKGELVASESQVEQFTSADQTLALGTQVDVAGKAKVAKVEATLGLDNKTSMEDAPNLPVGKVKVKKDEYGTKTAVFEVKNPGVEAQKSARIGVVCFDKSDKIIGGGTAYPDLIPAKGRVLVEANVTSAGTPDSCDAYAAPATF